MQTSSLKKNSILNIIYRLSNIIFPLIVYPYASRILFAENIGKVSFFTSLTNYMMLIGSLGIYTYGVREIAKVRNNKCALSTLTKELLIINTVVTVIVLLFLIILIPFINKFQQNFLLFIICLTQIAIAPFNMEWLYAGLEQYSYIAKRAIIFKILSIILIFMFVRNREDYVVYAAIIASGYIGGYICNLIHSREFINLNIKVDLQLKRHINSVFVLFASLLAINVYTNVNIIMLGFVCGDRAVGLYDIASKGQYVLLSLINAISSVLFPRLSFYLSENDIASYNAILTKSVSIILSIAIPIAAFLELEARDIVLVLGGADYIGAATCMQLLMPILVISGFSNITGNQILLPHGHDWAFMKAVGLGALVAVILNAIFMPRFSLYGAAFATLMAEVTQMSVQFIYSRKYLKGKIDLVEISKIVFATALSMLIVIYIKKFFVAFPLLNIIVYFPIYTVLYILCITVLRGKTINELYKQILAFNKSIKS